MSRFMPSASRRSNARCRASSAATCDSNVRSTAASRCPPPGWREPYPRKGWWELALPTTPLLLPPDVTVGLDLLLADVLAHRLLFRDGVLFQAHPLLGHRALLDDGLLLGEHDLVLLLRDVGPRHCAVGVALGDRLSLDAYLFALYRDRLGHVLGDDVLAEPHPAGLAPLRAHVQLLLRP